MNLQIVIKSNEGVNQDKNSDLKIQNYHTLFDLTNYI